MKLFPQDILNAFEFEKILDEIASRCQSAAGHERAKRIKPLYKYSKILKLLKQTHEMSIILIHEDKFPSIKMFDLREINKFLAIENYVLNEEQIHKLLLSFVFANEHHKFFSNKQHLYPELAQLSSHLVLEKHIALLIRAVLNEEGKLRNDASTELIKIRKEKESALRNLDRTAQQTLLQLRKMGVLSDVEESVRNGRRVFGIQSEYKRKIKGIVHDESDTGKTCFIETDEIVNIQNEIFEFEREEKREIYRILKQLTSELSVYKNHFDGYQWFMSILDITIAKAKYALEIQAQMPILEKYPVIHLYHARHPVLLQINKASKKEVIPLNVELDEENRILVISGPNAGGKSVSMKTIALLQLMIQSGLLIPADEKSRLGIFQQIFSDTGDAQSLEDELSTYSSRLLKMKYFLEHTDKNTIFFIDEFGTGTDPAAGGAIAESLLDGLNMKQCFGVITTHYSNLKIYASHHAGVINASMLYDEKELKPTFKLETGKPGSSYAFEIAHKIKLPDLIIGNAKRLVSNEYLKFEELLKNVRIEKEFLKLREKEITKRESEVTKQQEVLKSEIEKAKEKQRHFNLKKLEKEDESIRKMEQEFNILMQQLKSNNKEDFIKTKEQAKQLLSVNKNRNNKERRSQFIKSEPLHFFENIKVGTLVTLLGGSETGKVESIEKNQATVVFKYMRTKIPLNELIGVEQGKEVEKHVSFTKVSLDETAFEKEIDLRGKAKDEAMLELESFLDKALLRNVYQLRILHGKGTGVLREAVQVVLKHYPGVKKIEYETENMGGNGVTLVEF